MTTTKQTLIRYKAFINGEWCSAISGKQFTLKNPYNDSILGEIADCAVEDTKLAIQAAQGALNEWKSTTAYHRSKLLRRWYDLQIEYADELAQLLTLEQGKPLTEAKGEIMYGASFVEWFAEEARRIYGDTIPGHETNKRILVLKQPIGVVAAITPWNFPNSMITRKLAPALAAGCTCVVKPAQQTPLSANALAVLAEMAGIPKGVINIVHSHNAAEIGAELCANSIIKKLSFTGSTPIGKKLMAQCAQTVKKLSLELGGNAPFIVFEGANLEKAVEGAIVSKFRNAGQTCVCTNRIFVQAGIYDEFTHLLQQAISKLRTGNGLKEGVTIGPLIDDKALAYVEDLVHDAKLKGATVQKGGERDTNHLRIFPPTLLTDVDKSMRVFSEEIFGPIAPVFKFETEEDVMEQANATPYGLAAYFYGSDNAQIWRVAEALEYGMVGVNTGLISTTVAPFGGIKESGFGREGSKYGIEEYLEMKYVCMEI